MDGVLSDFEKRFSEKYGFESSEVRDRKNFSTEWPNFVFDKEFETLELFPGADKLLSFILQYMKDVPVEILTSSGGQKFHFEVSEQKKKWLKMNNINYPVNVVPGRRFKSDYAKPNVVLVDDIEQIIKWFNEAGGIGILHKNAYDTIDTLDKLLKR